jgi:uncharacterized protein (TIGR01777 family)
MRVAVTGGTGFVGSALVQKLLDREDEVWIITRSEGHARINHPKLHVVTWEESVGRPQSLEGIEAIVNLAGESIDQRWTDGAKDRILDSRLQAAGRIAYVVDSLREKPKVVVNASGISIYGTSETDTYDENSPKRIVDFLSSVVEKWEEAADQIKETPRLVKLRVGLVIGNEGGAFAKMAMPYRFYAGGRIGSGRQWIPWIHIEDMVRLILFCIDNPDISGPVNAASPNPVTNDQFGRALGKAMGKPHWFPVPAFLLKLIFGELATLLLEGQRALPKAALDAGFQYRYPTIDTAMQDLVSK